MLVDGFVPNFTDYFVILRDSGVVPIGGLFRDATTGLPLNQGDLLSVSGVTFQIDYQFVADGDGQANDVRLVAIPEPMTWGLLSVSAGVGSYLWYRRQRRRSLVAEMDVREARRARL
jgi:hypothetical protein